MLIFKNAEVSRVAAASIALVCKCATVMLGACYTGMALEQQLFLMLDGFVRHAVKDEPLLMDTVTLEVFFRDDQPALRITQPLPAKDIAASMLRGVLQHRPHTWNSLVCSRFFVRVLFYTKVNSC